MNAVKDISNFIFLENEQADLEQADIIFIPGCARPEMMEKASNLYLNGYAPILLPSGRYSITLGHFAGVQAKADVYDGNYKTESEFLIDVGVKNKVPIEKILIEDQATYTMQNAVYSKAVTDNAGLVIRKAIICCKSFHARRAYMYYQMSYPDTEFLIAPVTIDGITKDNWHQTELGRKSISGELLRISTQFDDLIPKE